MNEETISSWQVRLLGDRHHAVVMVTLLSATLPHTRREFMSRLEPSAATTLVFWLEPEVQIFWFQVVVLAALDLRAVMKAEETPGAGLDWTDPVGTRWVLNMLTREQISTEHRSSFHLENISVWFLLLLLLLFLCHTCRW